MNVEVIIEVSISPKKNIFDALRRAASSLTNNQKSITVQTTQKGDRIFLITFFRMKATAQYKVVDNIVREFEFQTCEIEGYQDMTISFPKSISKSDRKGSIQTGSIRE